MWTSAETNRNVRSKSNLLFRPVRRSVFDVFVPLSSILAEYGEVFDVELKERFVFDFERCSLFDTHTLNKQQLCYMGHTHKKTTFPANGTTAETEQSDGVVRWHKKTLSRVWKFCGSACWKDEPKCTILRAVPSNGRVTVIWDRAGGGWGLVDNGTQMCPWCWANSERFAM